MPFLLLDNFDAPGLWAAVDAGNLPSAEIALAAGGLPHPQAVDPDTMRVDLTGAATGHRIRRGLGPVDLNALDRLTFWLRADVPMRGAASDALRLRVRLGSAALAVGAVGNDWHRYLGAPVAGAWSYQSLDLSDLAPAVRGAVDTVEIDVTTGSAQTFWLDGMEARRSAPVSDADAGLLARLDGGLMIGGAPVPCVVAPDAAAQPFLRLVQYESLYGRGRDAEVQRLADHTDAGPRLRPPPVPWDVFYRAEPVAQTRAEQGAMLDFLLTELGPRAWLAVGNQALRVEQIPGAEPDDALRAGPAVRFRVSAWAEAPAPGLPVVPVDEVTVATGIAGAGG